MLDFVFRIEIRTIVEPVPDAEHGTRQIELGLARVMYRMGVVDLTVPPQAQIRRDAARRRGGGRTT